MTRERESRAGSDPGAAPPGRRDLTSIYQAKLRPAVNSAYVVPRPRLVDMVDRAVTTPLTLVVAPAGSGKTSLLRDWAGRTSLPHAWLSVDESDRDPAQLWLGVLAALEGIAPGCAERPARLLRLRRTLLGPVGVLLDDLETRPYDPRVLVIDDLELGDGGAATASLSMFVQHLPGWLRVVVASRRTPRLPVDRLRARGMLSELRYPELRFSDEESVEMLSRLAPTMPADRLEETARQAEGWAASIQLAGLAARSADARTAPGAPRQDVEDRYLEDYVWHEVLRGEPPDVVEVLASTAVVARVGPDLARALTGRDDAADLLALAEERGLFTARTEPSGTYEMHALVRKALVALQHRRSPGRVAELHRLAARWFERDGQPVIALEHLLRAGEHRDGLRLLATCVAQLYDSGREDTVRRTVAAVQESIPAADLAATIDLAWCLLHTDRGRFVQTVDDLAPWTDQDLDVEPTLRARLDVLQALASTVRGDWAGGARLARSALATIGDAWLLDPLVRYGWNLVAREIALAERWNDASTEVRKVVLAISAAPERRVALEGTRALGHALAGHPVDALRLVAGARQAAEASNLTVLHTELLTAEAIADREIGDASAALPVLVRLAETGSEPVPHCRLLACLELARSWLDGGDLGAAERAFAQARLIVETEFTGPGGGSWLARTGALLALADGRPDEARRWVSQIDDPFWAGVKTSRVLLAEGDAGAVGDVLRDVEPRCARHHVVRDLLLSRVATSPAEAEAHLLRAVERASAHGLVQTVAAEGPEVVESIERLAWRVPQAWLHRLRRVPLAGSTPSTALALERARPLTDRQLGILRMLPSRLTLREIADELSISVNTLKFHLKVIYRDLDCASRAEASELARALASPPPRGQPSSTRRR